MNINALSQMLANAETLQGKHQEQEHEKTLLIGAGETGGIAPETPPELNRISLHADFIEKSETKKIDNITVSRDTQRDVIHITIELL